MQCVAKHLGVKTPGVLTTPEPSTTKNFVVVVVEWLYYSKRIIFVRWADLSDFFSFIFVGKMCVFVSRPMKIVTFLRKNDYLPKRVVDFPRERDSEKKSWKSSKILTKK